MTCMRFGMVATVNATHRLANLLRRVRQLLAVGKLAIYPMALN